MTVGIFFIASFFEKQLVLDKCEIMSMQLRISQAGGLFDNNRRLPNFVREMVLDLHYDGVSQRTIAQQLCTSRHFVPNVLGDYDLTNSFFQPPKRHKGHTFLTPDAAEYIKIEKLCKPSIYASELQNRLVLDGVLHPTDLPHPSTITKFVRNQLLMTKKKIHAVPSESRTAEIKAPANFFLDQVSDLAVSTIHFFAIDEASVTKTTMNRRYGNSIIGTSAFEIQRSASNATFTINLLHSCLGVDFVNILESASNDNELLFFL